MISDISTVKKKRRKIIEVYQHFSDLLGPTNIKIIAKILPEH